MASQELWLQSLKRLELPTVLYNVILSYLEAEMWLLSLIDTPPNMYDPKTMRTDYFEILMESGQEKAIDVVLDIHHFKRFAEGYTIEEWLSITALEKDYFYTFQKYYKTFQREHAPWIELAAECGSMRVVKELMHHNYEASSILYGGTRGNHREMVDLALENMCESNVDINIKTPIECAFDDAMESEHPEMLEYLLLRYGKSVSGLYHSFRNDPFWKIKYSLYNRYIEIIDKHEASLLLKESPTDNTTP
jgi:hypothetical protein